MSRISHKHGQYGRQRGAATVTYERSFDLSSVETHKITGLYLDALIDDFWLREDGTLMRRIDAEGRGSDWDEEVKDIPVEQINLISQAIVFRGLMTALCVFGAKHMFNAKGKCTLCHHQQPKEVHRG